MKKYLFLLALPFLVTLHSCKKMVDTTDVISGGDYQPLTANSTWTYQDIGTGYTTTTTMGAAVDINGARYYAAASTSTGYSGTQTGYYKVANHFYSIRSTTLSANILVDMVYLNDALPVGGTWTSKLSDNGSLNGVPAQTIGKIIEIGITKTVSGKTFTNVIHSQLYLQYDLGSGFETWTTYDFYVAKNIGVIQTDANIPFANLTTSSKLLSYSIK
jgi:hypothetical protein